MRKILSTIRGFTLAEIVIVVAIITLLVSVVGFGLRQAAKSSNDKKRLADLQALQLAIRLYKDVNGVYPPAGSTCGTGGGVFTDNNNYKWATPGPVSGNNFASCDEYISGLVPQYIAALPKDPSAENKDNAGFMYMTDVTRGQYKLVVFDTVEVDSKISGADYARCPTKCPHDNRTSNSNFTPWCSNTKSYAIYQTNIPGINLNRTAPCW